MILHLTALLAWASLGVFPFLLLGWIIVSSDPITTFPGSYLQTYGGIVFAIGALAVALNLWLYRRRGRDHLFSTVLAVLVMLATIYGAEAVARLFAPGWPARGLHAVNPLVAEAGWSLAISRPGALGVNGWGQRDLERDETPPDGRRRMVFVGDSILETSVLVPVSVVVEEKMKDQGIETVNLGVAASAPDEYFWRLKNIGLALGAERAVVFLYAGNDWIDGPTLPTFHGIAAPYPRDSVLETVGLAAINHHLMWKERPLIRAWFSGAEKLLARENKKFEEFRRTPDKDIPEILARYFQPKYRDRVLSFLSQRDLGDFYAGLRDPDAGLYRSYYLNWALKYLGFSVPLNTRVNERAIQYVFGLLEAMQALCRDRGVELTVVLSPEASQVDPRFRAYWANISLLHLGLYYKKITSDRIKALALQAGMDVLDLHEALKEAPGTYLNLDGHWTEKGVEMAAAAIAAHFREESAAIP